MTICNSNRISCERFKTVYDQWNVSDTDTYSKLHSIACLNVCPLSIDVKQLSCPPPGVSRKKRSSSDEQPPPPNGLGGMPANLKAQYEFLALYMGLNERVRLTIGHQFEDFIKECTFLGSDCLDIRYFYPTF